MTSTYLVRVGGEEDVPRAKRGCVSLHGGDVRGQRLAGAGSARGLRGEARVAVAHVHSDHRVRRREGLCKPRLTGGCAQQPAHPPSRSEQPVHQLAVPPEGAERPEAARDRGGASESEGLLVEPSEAWLQCGYSVVTVRLQCGYKVVTRLVELSEVEAELRHRRVRGLALRRADRLEVAAEGLIVATAPIEEAGGRGHEQRAAQPQRGGPRLDHLMR